MIFIGHFVRNLKVKREEPTANISNVNEGKKTLTAEI